MLEAKRWSAIIKHLLAHTHRAKTPPTDNYKTLARVTFADGAYTFESVDGHRAIRIRVKAAEGSAATPPATDAVVVAKSLPHRVVGRVSIEPFNGGISIRDIGAGWRIPAAGTPFPPIDRVIPSDHRASQLSRVTADPKYMAAAYAAIGELCGGESEIQIGVDPLDPILISGVSEDGDVKVTCIVMPIREGV